MFKYLEKIWEFLKSRVDRRKLKGNTMSKKTIHQQLAGKTFTELGLDPKTGKPLLTSPNKRNLRDPRSTPPFRIPALEKTKRQSSKGKAYQYSALYRNAVILRLLVKKFTNSLSPKKFHRLISQLDSAARSVVANIREGYVRPSSKEYSIFLAEVTSSLTNTCFSSPHDTC